MRVLLPILIVVASTSLLMGCASQTHDGKTFTVSDSQTYFLEESSYPDTELFNRTIHAAIDGNDGALAKIFSWKQLTDGEGALNYSSMLLDLRAKVGITRFERAMQTLQPEEQVLLQGNLNDTLKMRRTMMKSGLQ